MSAPSAGFDPYAQSDDRHMGGYEASFDYNTPVYPVRVPHSSYVARGGGGPRPMPPNYGQPSFSNSGPPMQQNFAFRAPPMSVGPRMPPQQHPNSSRGFRPRMMAPNVIPPMPYGGRQPRMPPLNVVGPRIPRGTGGQPRFRGGLGPPPIRGPLQQNAFRPRIQYPNRARMPFNAGRGGGMPYRPRFQHPPQMHHFNNNDDDYAPQFDSEALSMDDDEFGADMMMDDDVSFDNEMEQLFDDYPSFDGEMDSFDDYNYRPSDQQQFAPRNNYFNQRPSMRPPPRFDAPRLANPPRFVQPRYPLMHRPPVRPLMCELFVHLIVDNNNFQRFRIQFSRCNNKSRSKWAVILSKIRAISNFNTIGDDGKIYITDLYATKIR